MSRAHSFVVFENLSKCKCIRDCYYFNTETTKLNVTFLTNIHVSTNTTSVSELFISFFLLFYGFDIIINFIFDFFINNIVIEVLWFTFYEGFNPVGVLSSRLVK